MKKVAPSERFRAELDEALAGVGAEQDPVETIGRLGARLILQQALEDEVTEFLGRRPYERAEETVSYRSGYEPRMVKTTSGSVELERPRVRDASKLGFESRVLGKHVTRTHALESLVIGSFLRGLSTRDVEAVLEETFDEPISSRSTVSRSLEDTRERYRRWCERRLDEHDVVYCFLDAIYLKLHPDDEPAEGVLVCWGVTLEGRKVLLGLQLGSRESYEAWLAFGRDLVARGLRSPALIVADGAPGLWKAARQLWPAADEQRCAVHYADVGHKVHLQRDFRRPGRRARRREGVRRAWPAHLPRAVLGLGDLPIHWRARRAPAPHPAAAPRAQTDPAHLRRQGPALQAHPRAGAQPTQGLARALDLRQPQRRSADQQPRRTRPARRGDLRMLSLGSQSQHGERRIERLLSASTTCRLQRRSLFVYLTDLLASHARGARRRTDA